MEESGSVEHESFGQISFSRVTGKARFYGSEIEQDNYISMEIHSSQMKRKLSTDWFHPQKLLTRIRMSSLQFAEMITSLNQGSGVCCTIEYTNAKKMQPLPEIQNRKELTHNEFRERMKSFAQKLLQDKKEAEAIIKKKNLTQADANKLLLNIGYMTTEITNNIPFFLECFQETMDRVVSEVKMEVEGAIQHKITALGLNALQEQNQLLISDKE